jgi:Predicted membrane protein (DUF2232)
VSADEGTTPARERGWLGPLFALLVLVMVTTLSAPRIVVPVGDILLLLAPVTAACAVAGWRAGGRPPLAVIWTAFALWVLWHQDPMRGWAVLLALAFGVVAVSGVGETFLPKALLALLAASLFGVTALLLVPGGPAGAVELVTAEIARRAILATQEWQALSGTPEWSDLVARSPGWAVYGQTVEAQLQALPRVALRIFPALFALQSLAVLALGWAVYHRVGRARLGPPLAKLRDLRFHEAFVWGVVAGLVLVVLPTSGAGRDMGINLLLFFGALYALRGMGVLIWFLSPGRAMTVLLVLFTVFFWQVVVTVSAGLGLGDTWFDWRRTSRPRSQRSE